MGQRVIRRPAFIEPTTSPSTPLSSSSPRPSPLASSYVFPIALASGRSTLDPAFGRRSPGPSRRRQQKILSFAEEVALVWGLRYRWGVASWEEAARDEGRGTRDESYQTDQLKTSTARLWTLDSRPPPPQPSPLDPRLWFFTEFCG